MQVDHHVFSLEIRIKVYLPDSQAAVHGCIDRLSLVIKASFFFVFFCLCQVWVCHLRCSALILRVWPGT